MRYNYKGFWNCDSCCDIEVHRRSDGKYVFVATELPDNRGTSVTNFAEQLATAMRTQYALKPGDEGWPERRLRLSALSWYGGRLVPHSGLDQNHGASRE